MIDDAIRVLAGDCTVRVDGTDREEYRGRVVTVVKPDDTVLVHDVDGYQPVAWLTRADSVSCDRGGDFDLVARDGDRVLRIAAHEGNGFDHHPATVAGTPIGDCPDCGGTLVRSSGAHCVDCGVRYGLPTDATIRDDDCECGLPRMRVERGREFDVCIDRDCESLDGAIRAAFDREWNCRDCDGDLLIRRRRSLIAGCEHYPDCDTGFVVPTGVLEGECSCGLPSFETGSGRRCLDATCDQVLDTATD